MVVSSSFQELNKLLDEFAESDGDVDSAYTEGRICAVLSSSEATSALLCSDTAEQVGLFARRSTQHVLKGAASGRLKLQRALSRFFVSAADLGDEFPMTAVLTLGGLLLALRQGFEHALAADVLVALQFVQSWLAGGALEVVVTALIRRNHMFSPEVAQAASGWLCGLQDQLAAACARIFHEPTGKDFVEWLESSYLSRLVETLLMAMRSEPCFHHLEMNPSCWDILGRMSLRGNASALARAFCKAALTSMDFAVMLGKSISRLADQHPQASRALVCAILRAAGTFFQTSGCRLVVCGDEGMARFSALIHPSLGTGRPIQQLLAVQLWQKRCGSELSSAAVFFIVDTIHAAGVDCWWPAYAHWLEAWADPSHFQSSDLAAERNLALRLARAARVHIADQDPIPGHSSKYLLQGIHLRLSAQTRERRLLGMALAELLAERWCSGVDEQQKQLRFDGFDRRDAAVADFQLAGADFEVVAGEVVAETHPQVPSVASFEKEEVEELPCQTLSQAEPQPVPEEDSDDEDECHPLRGLSPLQPLDVQNDSCSDLLLVQHPTFLQSAYEMLLGPVKTPSTPLSDEAFGKPGSAPEPPAVARARIWTALADLPALLAAGSDDLPRLAEPLCVRLLRLEVSGQELQDMRVEALVALLVADASRRQAVQCLTANFTTEDLSLNERRAILLVLSSAAQKLSSKEVEETRAAGQGSSPAAQLSGKSRRFASATKMPASFRNRFSAEARHFVLPLVNRWKQPDGGAAKWAVGEPNLVAEFLRSLAVMLECAGRACSDREVLCQHCVELAEEALRHLESQVRRCSLFLLSRIVLVGCEGTVLDKGEIIDQLEALPFKEADETCRRMAAGILACLSMKPQHSSVLWPCCSASSVLLVLLFVIIGSIATAVAAAVAWCAPRLMFRLATV
ncbi:telo2 [Symbiodinium sp. CCMP2592]|nr:telo2 [Symbiodinium sp. CCMP2592]